MWKYIEKIEQQNQNRYLQTAVKGNSVHKQNKYVSNQSQSIPPSLHGWLTQSKTKLGPKVQPSVWRSNATEHHCPGFWVIVQRGKCPTRKKSRGVCWNVERCSGGWKVGECRRLSLLPDHWDDVDRVWTSLDSWLTTKAHISQYQGTQCTVRAPGQFLLITTHSTQMVESPTEKKGLVLSSCCLWLLSHTTEESGVRAAWVWLSKDLIGWWV